MPIKVNERTLIEGLWGKDSYALLFLLLLVDYLVMSLVNSTRWGGLARTVPVAVTVLFALHTSDARRAVLRVAQAAVALSLVTGVIQAVVDNNKVGGVSFLLVGLLLLVTPVAVLRRILPKRTVDVETLFAAVDVYIVIGLIFSTLFIGIAHIHTNPPFLAQPPPTPHVASDYVYLSYVTLTTVGFGDLTPLTSLARSVVVLEALIGQIFLVTLVARLVALYSADVGPGRRFISRTPSHRRQPGPDDLREDPEAAEPDGAGDESDDEQGGHR